MKLRRSMRQLDLRALPLDAVDMFLLSRLDTELTLSQLADVAAPCDPHDTERRVVALARLGLVEGLVLAPEPTPSVHAASDEELVTLRPPVDAPSADARATLRPRAPDSDSRVTLRPSAPLPLDELFEADSWQEAPTGTTKVARLRQSEVPRP